MADVQLEQSHPARFDRVRRLPVIRAFGVRVPLVARIALASALLAVLVAAAFAILVITLSTFGDTTTAANRSKDVTSATLVLEQDLLQLDSALRGFVNTGDRRFLRALRNVRADLPASMTALTRASAGSEGHEQRARQLVQAVREYEEDYAVPIVGIAEFSPATARSPVALAEGRRRLDALRRQVTQVLTMENDLASARVSSATNQANRAILVGLAALGVSVLLVLLFGVELSRAVAHPVRRVSEAAKHVAAGDLSVRLTGAWPRGGLRPFHGLQRHGGIARAQQAGAGRTEPPAARVGAAAVRADQRHLSRGTDAARVRARLRVPVADASG